MNTAVVFDNLIDKGDMPITIGLFVAPGDKGRAIWSTAVLIMRSFRYDSLGDQYARFLIEELPPPVGRVSDCCRRLSQARDLWLSSGGICVHWRFGNAPTLSPKWSATAAAS
ncbi:MAG: hypothetical protein U0X20_25040 [Caldilineaceae bacterium]